MFVGPVHISPLNPKETRERSAVAAAEHHHPIPFICLFNRNGPWVLARYRRKRRIIRDLTRGSSLAWLPLLASAGPYLSHLAILAPPKTCILVLLSCTESFILRVFCRRRRPPLEHLSSSWSLPTQSIRSWKRSPTLSRLALHLIVLGQMLCFTALIMSSSVYTKPFRPWHPPSSEKPIVSSSHIGTDVFERSSPVINLAESSVVLANSLIVVYPVIPIETILPERFFRHRRGLEKV